MGDEAADSVSTEFEDEIYKREQQHIMEQGKWTSQAALGGKRREHWFSTQLDMKQRLVKRTCVDSKLLARSTESRST